MECACDSAKLGVNDYAKLSFGRQAGYLPDARRVAAKRSTWQWEEPSGSMPTQTAQDSFIFSAWLTLEH
jgi:hypothetical protein